MHDPVESFIADLRREADSHHFMDLAAPAIAVAAKPSPWAWVKTRAATVAAAVFLAIGSVGGTAYAANGASPGDLLYPIDTFFEGLGIGDGGSAERLQEVAYLLESGEIGRGLDHAAANIGDAEAQAALTEAAQRVADNPAPDGVPSLLTYLSEHPGAIDGRTVAELARQIGGPPDGTPAGPGDPGPPVDIPGKGPPGTP